jgi:hypothetical protein
MSSFALRAEMTDMVADATLAVCIEDPMSDAASPFLCSEARRDWGVAHVDGGRLEEAWAW